MSDFTKPENMTGNYIRNIYMCNFKIVKYRDLRILKYFICNNKLKVLL